MNNNPFVPTNTPRQTPPPPGQPQPLPQPAQPDHSVTQHPQQSHFQAPPAPAYNPQWTVPQPYWPPSQQSAFNTNYDDGSQWHGQQHQYHVPPPVAHPLPQPAAQPNYNSYQPTGGYPWHYIPQPVASPQPQRAYYPHPQPQQLQLQQSFYHPLPQPLMQNPTRLQQFDSPDFPSPLQPQYLPLPSPAQNTGVNPGQSQGQAGQFGSGVRARWLGGKLGGAASIQAEGHNTIPTFAKSVVPVVTQLQGAQGFTFSGNPILTNISTNTGNLTTVNNYGGTHGLENLKEFVSFSALHDSAEQDPDRRCHPGTRENVLQQLRFWFNNPNPTDPIIWLHGPVGAGKSAIAQTIADEYKERGLVATFFFYRSDPSRNDGNRLFPTIAWQLAFSIPAVKDFIVHELSKTPHLPTKHAETQFEELVAHPFHAMNHIATQMLHPGPAWVVIIDGVDECSDEHLQRRFLTIIGDAVKDARIPLRFLIVSRPEALIEETFNKFKDFTVSIDLAKLDDSNRDIQKYLEDKFSEIATNRGLDPAWPGQEIIEEVLFKSSGNFIFASVVIRFISDEDFDPEFLLNIVRNLTLRGNMSPFAILDELYLEILKRQRDQDFLKAFLALLVGRSSIEQDDLHKDDAMLMNVSEKDLHIRLRRMRSLLKFKPSIDVYHKSFFDFLQDSSRSGQYHVSKQNGLKRYLELVADSVVRHVSMVIEQPNCHKTCCFRPKFKSIVKKYPPKIVLPVEDWQAALKLLLDLQDKLLNTSKPKPCRAIQVMRDLLLHLVFLQRKSDHIAATHVPGSNMNETVTRRTYAPVTDATQHIPETDLDRCLSALLSCLQKTNSIMVVDGALIDHMSSLLAFDCAETVARVRSISDAQKLIDSIDLLNNNECFLNQCGPDAARKAAHLASNIFAKVPILPLSLVLNRSARHLDYLRTTSETLEFICQSVLISKILDHNYILPALGIYDKLDRLQSDFGNVIEQAKRIDKWLERSSPDLITRIRVMLEIVRSIRYIHSMDIALYSYDIISWEGLFLDSNLRTKFIFQGLFAWWSREASIYGHEDKDLFTRCTYEANISAFANLFDEVCFRCHNENTPGCLADNARQLLKRCRVCNPKRRPTMEDVVKEMETWNF